MTKNLLTLAFISTLILFQGCSQKQYFEPEVDTYSTEIDIYDVESTITDYHPSGATLENGGFISVHGISKLTLDEGFRFLNQTEDIVLSTNDDGILQVRKGDNKQTIQFEKNVVSASISQDLIAFILIDNSIGLYDINEEKFVLREYLSFSMLNDTRIASPIFLNSLILFPSLDGKVVIVDKGRRAIYKTINLDPDGDINNIIYINALGNTLVAATNNKIFSFVDGNVTTISHEVRDITADEESIFVATLDGRIIKFDQNLKELASQKFKFAKFHAIAYGRSLYALESQGYLIELDNALENYAIYDFSFDEEEKVFSLKNRIYFEDNYIILK